MMTSQACSVSLWLKPRVTLTLQEGNVNSVTPHLLCICLFALPFYAVNTRHLKTLTYRLIILIVYNIVTPTSLPTFQMN